jgi:hypothetical protein
MIAKRRMLIPLTASTVIALGALAVPSTAVAAPTAPFNATYVGSFSGTTTGFSVRGTGHATLLGSSTNRGAVVMQSEPNPTCPTTGFVVTNNETLTAANGDHITITMLDEPCPVQGEPGIYDGVAQYVITGGTGRFVRATGTGTFDGRGDFNKPDDLTFTYSFNGTISTPNAS